MKYKVGDKVKIKSLDWYNTNKDEEGDVDLIHTMSGSYNFIKLMCEFCEKIMTIKDVNVHGLYYSMLEDDDQFYWTDDMIECLVGYIVTSESVNTSTLTITNEEVEKCRIKIPEIPQSINLTHSNVNEIEVVLGDYEFVLKDGKTYFVKKKPQYPKTYEECCDILDIHPSRELQPSFFTDISEIEKDLSYKLSLLYKLYICRNAYWKIAGEQMGLDKPWKPDWDNENEFKYSLYYFRNRIVYDFTFINPSFLTFPTAEMRDAFHENFKDMIEQCKELL